MTPTSQKRLVLVGATGMVGGYALRYSLENAAVGTVTAIVRRKLGISHPKLQEVLHRDFADCSALSQVLSGQDAALFCLGAYTGAVSDAELRRITVDYTIEFARVLRGSSPNVAFSFLSGSGADPSGCVLVFHGGVFECSSRMNGKPSSPVLRGLGASNGARPLDHVPLGSRFHKSGFRGKTKS